MYNCLNVLYLAIFSKTGVTYFRFPSPAHKKRTIAGSLFSYGRYARPSTLPHPYISSLGKGTCFFGSAENLADECHADTFWGISCQFGGSEYDFDTNLAISCSRSPSM